MSFRRFRYWSLWLAWVVAVTIGSLVAGPITVELLPQRPTPVPWIATTGSIGLAMTTLLFVLRLPRLHPRFALGLFGSLLTMLCVIIPWSIGVSKSSIRTRTA